MERRLLGQTDLALTPLGLGAWAIGGGDWCLGWGPQRDEHSIATIRRAIARGINWIDTAGVYGLGRSEAVIARALRVVPRIDRPFVFTKCGFVWDELGNVARDLSSRSIRRQAEDSLRRLSVDVLDLYQLDPSSGERCRLPSHGGSLEEAWDALAALQREGKVRHIGVSGAQPAHLAQLAAIAPVASVQAPYSLLQREIEDDVLPHCEMHAIGVLASSPMASGRLTGAWTAGRLRWLPHNDWRRCSQEFQPDEIVRALHVVDRLRPIGTRQGVTPGAVAIAWTLRHPTVTAAIVGARRPEQVDELTRAASLKLGAEDFQELNQTGGEITARATRLPTR